MSQPDLIQFFSSYVAPERLDKMRKVLEQRTRHITVVLEDIYQPHNASAVLRTCDCLGIQDVHIIENRNKYEVNPDVVLGSEKWLSLKKYNGSDANTAEALNNLKSKGYTLLATAPGAKVSMFDVPVDKPLAIMMGTELHGLSEEALAMADVQVSIPMYGFTQSFNISVSAALILNQLIHQLRGSSLDWHLNAKEREEILLEWLRRSVKRSDLLERAYFKRGTVE